METAKFVGEFDCRLDAKNRIIIPSALKKQIPTEANDKFVLNRGFEKCLVLYPKNEWDKLAAELGKLNQFVKENRIFIRQFYNGATEVELDSAARLLIPKTHLQFANIDKEITLFGYGNKIEIWDTKAYLTNVNMPEEDFASLAEKVMGSNNINL